MNKSRGTVKSDRLLKKVYGGRDLWKRQVLNSNWKSERVMENKSVDIENDGLKMIGWHVPEQIKVQ